MGGWSLFHRWSMREEPSRPAVDVAEAPARELLMLFEWHDFEDPVGHRLLDCDDFRELVERATGESLDDRASKNRAPEKGP